MLGLGAAAMTGRLALERFNDIAGNVSYEQLGHKHMLSCDSKARNAAWAYSRATVIM